MNLPIVLAEALTENSTKNFFDLSFGAGLLLALGLAALLLVLWLLIFWTGAWSLGDSFLLAAGYTALAFIYIFMQSREGWKFSGPNGAMSLLMLIVLIAGLFGILLLPVILRFLLGHWPSPGSRGSDAESPDAPLFPDDQDGEDGMDFQKLFGRKTTRRRRRW